jgi:hypothetical protein
MSYGDQRPKSFQGTSIYPFLYLHSRAENPILSLAIINNPGVIRNSRELIEVPFRERGLLGRVDLLFKPEEGTDKVEKAQEVSGQFVKTRKYMSVLL